MKFVAEDEVAWNKNILILHFYKRVVWTCSLRHYNSSYMQLTDKHKWDWKENKLVKLHLPTQTVLWMLATSEKHFYNHVHISFFFSVTVGVTCFHILLTEIPICPSPTLNECSKYADCSEDLNKAGYDCDCHFGFFGNGKKCTGMIFLIHSVCQMIGRIVLM